VLADHCRLCIIVEALSKHDYSFAVAESVGFRERDVGSEREISRGFLP